MKIINSATEDDMIAAFLEAEFSTKRHGSRYAAALDHHYHHPELPEGFLSRKDYAPLRRDVLGYVRGWPDKALFKDFPACSWEKAVLETSDIVSLNYIPYSYWDELSNGTHQVTEGARSVLEGKIVFDQPNVAFWEIEKLTKAGKTFPPLIVLRVREGKYVLIEGHTRATAFGMAGKVPDGQPVMIGTPLEENNWAKEQKL